MYFFFLSKGSKFAQAKASANFDLRDILVTNKSDGNEAMTSKRNKKQLK